MDNSPESQDLDTEFAYTPLRGVELRLLCISSVQHDELGASVPEVQCTLQHFNMKTAPPYYAISYVWGDSLSRRQIRMNGARFHVTENLFDVLLEVYNRSSELLEYLQSANIGYNQQQLYFWIDAACLNQKDVAEKSKYVPKMGQIFGDAFTVFVWLGDLEAHRTDVDSILNQEEVTEEASRENQYHLGIYGFHLTTLPWFERVWVIQECALAQREPLFYHSQGRENVRDLYISLTRLYHREDAHLGTGSTKARYEDFLGFILQNLSSCLEAFQPAALQHLPLLHRLEYMMLRKFPRDCTLMHDHIYAFLGLIDATKLPRELEPDYSKPFADVAEAYTRNIFLETGSLALLGNKDLEVRPRMPSWVSDFTPHLRFPASGTMTSRKRQSNLQFANNEKELLVDGIVIEKVRDWTPALPKGSDRELKLQVLWYIINKLLAHVVKITKHSQANVSQAFIRSFANAGWEMPSLTSVSDMLLMAEDPSHADHENVMWFVDLWLKLYGYAVLENGDLLFFWPTYRAWGEGEHLAVMFVGAISVTILEKLEDGKYRYLAQAQDFSRIAIQPRMYEPPDEFFESSKLQRFTLV